MDVYPDGEVRGLSFEEYIEGTEQRGAQKISVLAAVPEGTTPAEAFVVLLAYPWHDPELPFPSAGWMRFLDELELETQGRRLFAPPAPPAASSGVRWEEPQLEF